MKPQQTPADLQSIRRPRWRGVAALLLALPLCSIAATDKKPPAVRDLRYGTALYHYFQRDYQTALTELLIAEQRGGIQGHGDTGLLMRGGLNLALGMEPQATDVFESLIDDSTPLAVRNAAWFYLGKLRYRQGDWQGAEQSLRKVTDTRPVDRKSPDSVADELQSLKINLAIKQQDFPRAEQMFGEQEKLTSWSPYIYYNLGAAHTRNGDPERGVLYFDALSELELADEEHRALRDKALTAAGYSLMLQQDYRGAMERFIQVRLHSPLSERALLGYGWAAMELEQYPMALSSWRSMAERSGFNSSVQEALLAIPYVYEKLRAPGQALAAYIDAATGYTDQLDEIEWLADTVNGDDLLAALQLSGDDSGAGLRAELLRLADFLSLQPLQNRAGELQRLLTMREQLQQWQRKVDIFQHLLAQREQVRGQKLQQIEQRRFSQQLQQMMAEGDKRAAELEQSVQNNDVMALLGADAAELWQRIERAEQNLQLLAGQQGDSALTPAGLQAYREALRRYRGQLLWRATEQYPDNLRRARKSLNQFQAQLATARENHRHLQQVIVEAPDIAPYKVRLDALQQRLLAQQTAVDNALQRAEADFRSLVLDELERQRNRLRYYQSQARLAVARLYDSGARTADHGNAATGEGQP